MSNTTRIHKSYDAETFTAISNDLIYNNDLKMTEKALLIFIISMPKDHVLSKCYLHECLPDSNYTIDKTFASLIEKGLIKSTKLKDSKGQFIGFHYEVYETPNSKYKFF